MKRLRAATVAVVLGAVMVIPVTGVMGAERGGNATSSPSVVRTPANADESSCAATAWSVDSVYTAGDRVSFGNRSWQAKWWTTAEAPTGSQWGVWADLGACTTDSTVGADPDACVAAVWGSAAVYIGGDQVSYDGRNWQAKWWTTGDVPTVSQWGVWADLGTCGATSPDPGDSPGDTPDDPPGDTPGDTPGTPAVAGDYVVGYFAEWGTYQRDYQVKDIVTSGSADQLTHIVYAFGNVTGGKCAIGDSYADYDKAFTAAQSVNGVADNWDQGLRGNFNQLRELKALYPNIKIIWSFGGWTWSGGFGEAAANPEAFAASCYDLVEDPRWADVFDGIDIDWEYPNACGLVCDTGGSESFPALMGALRNKFGSDLVTAAITADATSGGKIEAADYAGAAPSVDFFMPMTYDYNGAWNSTGPTAPHSALATYSGAPQAGADTTTTITKLLSLGVPSNKLLLGIGFYGRGWTGVTQSAPGGAATGPAPGTYEAGIEDYLVLKNSCPATGTVGGTAYAHCGDQWWTYDTPSTISGKMDYAQAQGLGGAFFWELSGDTDDGELITAISSGLK